MSDINAVVVAGSQNPRAQSLKVAEEIRDRLAKDRRFAAPTLIDLAAEPLPFFGDGSSADAAARVQSVGDSVTAADALVVVTPEWHGMATAAVKNFFLHYSSGQLAHKPGLIVTVSASSGGAYPVAELRSSSYKNSRICYLPEHLIVRSVGQVFNASGDNDPVSQEYLSKRLDFCLDSLAAYAIGFRAIRAALPDASAYPNGM
ncbi:MAG: NAD(P)H-dependent oxidoreductase [Pseudomonadota bacterium]